MAEALGLKSTFLREGATAGTYEEIAQVAGISPPQYQRNIVEVEDLNPPDQIAKKLTGLIDAGEFSITLNFDSEDTGHTDLEADFWAGEAKSYQIKLPTGKGWTVFAIVSGWAPQEIEAEGVIQVEVTLTVTAKPEFGEITGGGL